MPALQAPDWRLRAPTVLRPDLSAEDRRKQVMGWLSSQFTGRAPHPITLVVDYMTYEPQAAEVVDLIRGVRDELRSRNLGRVALVFTTEDDSLRDALRSLAAAYEVPIYVAPNRSAIDRAEPAISLTPAKRTALDTMAVLGRATASVVAHRTGGSTVAVGNTLAELHAQGLLLRHEGAGRIGHTYEHPSVIEATRAPGPMTTTIEVPDALSVEVAQVAEVANREPGELLAEAWREFMARNGDVLADRYAELSGLVQAGDRARLLEAVTRDSATRARATRPIRRDPIEGNTGERRASAGQSSRHE